MLVDKGFISAEEVAAGHAVQPPKPLKRGKFGLDDVERVMVRGKFGRSAPAPAKYKAGDRCAPKIFIRQPTRGCRTMCAAMSASSSVTTAVTSIPDTAAMRIRRRPAMALHRRFDSTELWGADADPTLKISVDACEPYLDRVMELNPRLRRATDAVPGMPRDEDGPVFREPWEAHAFAMALTLHEPRRVHLEGMGEHARR